MFTPVSIYWNLPPDTSLCMNSGSKRFPLCESSENFSDADEWLNALATFVRLIHTEMPFCPVLWGTSSESYSYIGCGSSCSVKRFRRSVRGSCHEGNYNYIGISTNTRTTDKEWSSVLNVGRTVNPSQ